MTDILTAPSRVNERSRTVYYFNGYVSVEVISGTEEQQRAAFLLVSQAQNMAKMLRAMCAGGRVSISDAEAVLRAAGVSDPGRTVEG